MYGLLTSLEYSPLHFGFMCTCKLNALLNLIDNATNKKALGVQQTKIRDTFLFVSASPEIQ